MTAATDVVREVGISHCNNVRSLIDHAHVADSLHYVLDTLRKELQGFLWDINYYLTAPDRERLLGVFDSVQHATADRHFRETVNNYHSHHFNLAHETESKGLRSWATEALAITQMYKQLVTESKRMEHLTEEYVRELVDKFVGEMLQHEKRFESLFNKYRARNASYDPLTTPILETDAQRMVEEDVEQQQPLKPLPPFRANPTWLIQRGERPGQTVKPFWMELSSPKPPGEVSSWQGGRNLYECRFNERKTALNQPKYAYKVEALHANNERERAERADRLLATPSRR